MKVLIAPLIRHPGADASYFLTQNLASLFTSNEIPCAVSADASNSFHNTALYSWGKVRPPFFASDSLRSYEEWLYDAGALQKSFLKDDLKCLEEAISHFRPDIIFAIDRPAANIAARSAHIPCWTFVNSAMYKHTPFPSKCIKGLNEILRENRLEQEFDLAGLYARSSRRLVFGTETIDPVPEDENLIRIGCSASFPLEAGRTNRVPVLLTDTNINPVKLKKILEDAYLGGPYILQTCLMQKHFDKEKNINFSKSPHPELISGAVAAIHDGNAYYANMCLTLGVPQLIITDHSYRRLQIAQAVQREKCGLYITEEELTMSSLYETWRRLVTDDDYYYGAKRLQKETKNLRDISDLILYTL